MSNRDLIGLQIDHNFSHISGFSVVFLVDIEEMLQLYVGSGCDTCNVTHWIKKMEEVGIAFPDDEPVFQIMGRLIYELALDEHNPRSQ